MSIQQRIPRDGAHRTKRRHITTRFSLGALVAVALLAACTSRHPTTEEPVYKGAVVIDVSRIHFDDGDTFFLDGEPVRVLGVDTPEIAHPEMGWLNDQPFGHAAAESTRIWLSRARKIEFVADGRDRYKRRLAHVFIDGELLSVRLLRHALAYETVSHYGDNGFPDLAQRIVDTARVSPKPQFEPPHRWKAKQRRRATRDSR